jgi:TRAP-type C4-dicarboxylate transport system substrate-binding protein
VKERTKGKFIIEPNPAGALIPSQEIFPAIKRGMIPIGYVDSGYYATDIPLGQVAALPMAISNIWEGLYINKIGGFLDLLRSEIDKHNVMFFPDHLEPTELVTKKPVRSFADFKGLKLRSRGLEAKFFTTIGAPATYIPGAEIYTALATGTVDGAHWGGSQGANSMAFYEICKYHLKPAITYTCQDGWFINKKEFAKLPKEYQEILYKTLDEQLYRRSVQYAFQEAQTLGKVQKEKGVQVITLPLEEQKKMAAAATAIWEKEGEKNPDCAKAVQLMKQFLKDIGRL